MRIALIYSILILFFVCDSYAFITEVGVTYGRKKTTFDVDNYVDTESTTGSISFYFWDRIATEFSYTDALGVRSEKAGVTDSKRTIVQKTQVIGFDLILILSDRKAAIQPYLKAGGAQLTRSQIISIVGFPDNPLSPETAITPSYGAGLKVGLTEALSIKVSYDVWQTPIGGGLSTDDAAIRAGLSWFL